MEATQTQSPSRVYTLTGQLAPSPLRALPRGIYIVNGRKVVVDK